MITIEVDDHAFRGYLQALQQRLGDLSKPMAEIGGILENRVRQRFETETDPSGRAWAPWAESTRKSYPKNGHHRILDRYGDMIKDVNARSDATSVRVGFPEDYATFHEFGTQRMPRRQTLFNDPVAGTLAPDDERAVIQVLESFLDIA